MGVPTTSVCGHAIAMEIADVMIPMTSDEMYMRVDPTVPILNFFIIMPPMMFPTAPSSAPEVPVGMMTAGYL